jgi:hypothetical protein
MKLIFDARLCFDALFAKGVFDGIHFGNEIGTIDQLGWRTSAGENDVGIGGFFS